MYWVINNSPYHACQIPEYEEVIVSASRANPGGEQDDVEMMKNAAYGPTQLDSKHIR